MEDKKKMIYKSGEKIFAEQGFKDTNVAQITSDAGIGVGTFYSYYKSKEELFMEIYLDRNKILKEQLMKEVDPDGEPLPVIMQLMEANYRGMMEDDMLRQWYDREVFSKVEEKYRQEQGIDAVGFTYDIFYDIIANWQKQGKMRSDIDTELIMALFMALINIDTHKDEIGIKYFPEVMNRLAEFIINGLTNK
jgi:AcrR family transcriptional regulator